MSLLNSTEIFEKINQLKVVVIGDLMLDQYIFGKVDRISPEAPVPVLRIGHKESRLGGAANVAFNCKSLGAEVTVASVIGDDENGHALKTLLEQEGIKTDLVHFSASRKTTTKSRIVSKGQQVMRLDEEELSPLNAKEEHPFIDATLRYLQIRKPDLVIFEDYNKGVLKENVIHRVLEHCQHLGLVTAVDPKFDNFLAYKGVDIFKPNLKEVQQGLNISIPEVELGELKEVHNLLYKSLEHKVTLLTLSEYGMFYSTGAAEGLIPTHVRNLADVSGAGDTVIAVAAMVYAVTRDVYTMANWSNIAGGLVCEAAGVVPVNKEKLANSIHSIIKNN
ncbi:MAG: carbohydrate kinase [Sphingobacteriales bacterium]|nr:MAG: carbohydrate kinase [Sphingobacteriales bacterium]